MLASIPPNRGTQLSSALRGFRGGVEPADDETIIGQHAHATAHPVIASAEAGEHWLYCYPDDAFADY